MDGKSSFRVNNYSQDLHVLYSQILVVQCELMHTDTKYERLRNKLQCFRVSHAANHTMRTSIRTNTEAILKEIGFPYDDEVINVSTDYLIAPSPSPLKTQKRHVLKQKYYSPPDHAAKNARNGKLRKELLVL